MSSSNPILPILGRMLSEMSCDTPPKQQQQQRNKSSSLSRGTVGSQFTSQLRQLRERIELTSPHYVRCLKPNDELVPDKFDHFSISNQLRCAGVLEAVRVSRVGYPQRYVHSMFIQRYRVLSKQQLLRQTKWRGEKDVCHSLVNDLASMIMESQSLGDVEKNVTDTPSKIKQRSPDNLIAVGI
eukprot:11005106-Ditylum_brightwellii.AAC.1